MICPRWARQAMAASCPIELPHVLGIKRLCEVNFLRKTTWAHLRDSQTTRQNHDPRDK